MERSADVHLNAAKLGSDYMSCPLQALLTAKWPKELEQHPKSCIRPTPLHRAAGDAGSLQNSHTGSATAATFSLESTRPVC